MMSKALVKIWFVFRLSLVIKNYEKEVANGQDD